MTFDEAAIRLCQKSAYDGGKVPVDNQILNGFVKQDGNYLEVVKQVVNFVRDGANDNLWEVGRLPFVHREYWAQALNEGTVVFRPNTSEEMEAQFLALSRKIGVLVENAWNDALLSDLLAGKPAPRDLHETRERAQASEKPLFFSRSDLGMEIRLPQADLPPYSDSSMRAAISLRQETIRQGTYRIGSRTGFLTVTFDCDLSSSDADEALAYIEGLWKNATG
jgi:hypothetical protein